MFLKTHHPLSTIVIKRKIKFILGSVRHLESYLVEYLHRNEGLILLLI